MQCHLNGMQRDTCFARDEQILLGWGCAGSQYAMTCQSLSCDRSTSAATSMRPIGTLRPRAFMTSNRSLHATMLAQQLEGDIRSMWCACMTTDRSFNQQVINPRNIKFQTASQTASNQSRVKRHVVRRGSLSEEKGLRS